MVALIKGNVKEIERVTLKEGNTVIASVRCARPDGVMSSLIRHFDPFQKWADVDWARKAA